MLEISSADSYFIFNGRTYKIKDGLGIGNPIAGTLANIFLCHHEAIWLEECPNKFKPIYYRRYIDDTYLQFRCESQVEPFLSYLNEKHANIKFTRE